ncbi:MAG: ROK family protein [Candidatus Omnitrophica bacterium]|nr:ROK family protein [Candidatus Omnitrophota bacterium]
MKKYIVGADIGGTHTKVALLDLSGHILHKTDFLTKNHKSGKLIKAVVSAVGEIIEKNKIRKHDILGLGIGLPGLVDFKKGLVFCLTNVPGWKNVALKKILEGETGLPVFVDNDVKVMAMGELRFGAGKGYKNIVCLTLGTGVGGAVIMDGNLCRGSSLVAGEIGHIPINEAGPLCNCGSHGCLEAYVGREYFLHNARKKLRSAPNAAAMRMVRGNVSLITPELLKKAAEKGDSVSIGIWQEAGLHIGNAIAGVVNLLNPQLVIIGGGMAEAGEIIFSSIKKAVNKKSMKIPAKAVKIVKAKLGNDAALIGAAEMVKDNSK